MRKTKKWLAALLAAALLVSTAACGSPSSSGSSSESSKGSSSASSAVSQDGSEPSTADVSDAEPGWKQHADEPITLQWYVNYSWFPRKWEGSKATEKYTKDTGINVELIIPAGNEAEKLNTMIASDTLPDLITLGCTDTQVAEMIDAEMVLPLNKLADEHDPYFYKVANQERLAWYTQDDGNVYGYPNASYSFSDYEKYGNIPSNQVYMVRKDMYEALGKPDMTTPEGFVNTLVAAKEKFPDVDGSPLIPLGTHEFGDTGCWALESYLQNFLAIPYEVDGKWYDRYTDPEYITWLKALRECGEKGLLANDIFVDKRSQMEEKIVQGRYFSMLYQRTDMATQQKIVYENDPEKIYIAIDGPKNSKGDDYTLPGGSIQGWTLTMIGANTEHPDRCIQFFSYFMEPETQMTMHFGPEGVGYTMVDGKPQWIEEAKELSDKDTDAFENQINGGMWMLLDYAMQLEWSDPPKDPLGQLEEWTYDYAFNPSVYNITTPAADSEEMTIKTNIEALWGKTLPKLLLAPTEEEFDQIFEQWKKDRDAAGFDKWMAYQQAQYEKNKEKLGL